MIQVLDWLYENSLRAYPLKETLSRKSGSYQLPNNVILDAQIRVDDLSSDYSITSITVAADSVTFVFSDADSITVSQGITANYYHRTASKLLVFGLGLNDIPDGTYSFSNTLVFEPSVMYDFGGAWQGVKSLSFDSANPSTGNLNFIEGYQFDLFLSAQTIKFAVGSLYGNQIGCTSFSDYPTDCSDIISSINGVGPDGKKELAIRAGNGFVVWDDPLNHRIYVGFAFTSTQDICGDIPPFPV